MSGWLLAVREVYEAGGVTTAARMHAPLDEIANASQPHEGIATRTKCNAKASDFCQAASNQCGPGIEAKTKAITDAGGNCQHILDGATNLGADQIVIRVNAHAAAMQ